MVYASSLSLFLSSLVLAASFSAAAPIGYDTEVKARYLAKQPSHPIGRDVRLRFARDLSFSVGGRQDEPEPIGSNSFPHFPGPDSFAAASLSQSLPLSSSSSSSKASSAPTSQSSVPSVPTGFSTTVISSKPTLPTATATPQKVSVSVTTAPCTAQPAGTAAAASVPGSIGALPPAASSTPDTATIVRILPPPVATSAAPDNGIATIIQNIPPPAATGVSTIIQNLPPMGSFMPPPAATATAIPPPPNKIGGSSNGGTSSMGGMGMGGGRKPKHVEGSFEFDIYKREGWSGKMSRVFGRNMLA